jgi:hypothetical protein
MSDKLRHVWAQDQWETRLRAAIRQARAENQTQDEVAAHIIRVLPRLPGEFVDVKLAGEWALRILKEEYAQ